MTASDAHGDRVRGPLAAIARGCARHRILVIVLTAMLAGGLGVGVNQLEFDDNPFDSLPRDNPHTEATQRLLEYFPGASYASAVFFQTAPDKWANGNDMLQFRPPPGAETEQFDGAVTGLLDGIVSQGSDGQSGLARQFPGPNNITDEVYLRAHEEFWQFIQDRVDGLAYDLTISANIKLVNYTNTGIPGVQPPDASAYTYPWTDAAGAAQYAAAWQGRYAASPSTIASLVSEDWTSIRNVYLFKPGDATLNEAGIEFEAAVDEYKDALRTCDLQPVDCELTWNVFHADEVVVDPRTGTAAAEHLASTTLEDLIRLAPIAGIFLAVAFFLAFRRVTTVLALAIPMNLAGLGVMGAFGWVGLPIHSVSLLVFPILMGNGIDFAFHMTAAYHHARALGRDPVEAAAAAGRSAGTPLFLATLTTLVGMLLLVWAPNVLLAQLGVAIMIGMAMLLIVSLTTLPAVLTWTRPHQATESSPLGRALERSARWWGKRRALGAVFVAVLAAGSLWTFIGGLDILVVGTPAAYFPEGDSQRDDFDATNEVYFGGDANLVTNLLVLEGDLTQPATHDFLEDLEATFREVDWVLPESVASINFAMKSWIQVRNGTAGAPAVLTQEAISPGSTFPSSQSGIEEILDEIFTTPLDNYISFFIRHPTYDIGVFVVEMEQPEEFDALEDRWDELLGIIAQVQARHPDNGLDIHVTGATAAGYLFAKEEIPYLQTAALVSLGVAGLIVLVIRRSPRDAATVALVVAASGLWWTALLKLLGIPLSITLVGPVVLIAAIGSDYALHLRYGLRDEGPAAWRTVGRAVFYSAITDIGAFLIFTQMRYAVLRDATVATAAALACALVATLVIVPIMASRDERGVEPIGPDAQTSTPTLPSRSKEPTHA